MGLDISTMKGKNLSPKPEAKFLILRTQGVAHFKESLLFCSFAAFRVLFVYGFRLLRFVGFRVEGFFLNPRPYTSPEVMQRLSPSTNLKAVPFGECMWMTLGGLAAGLQKPQALSQTLYLVGSLSSP